MLYADMAELADALDSGSSEHCAHAGSIPVIRTKKSTCFRQVLLNFDDYTVSGRESILVKRPL